MTSSLSSKHKEFEKKHLFFFFCSYDVYFNVFPSECFFLQLVTKLMRRYRGIFCFTFCSVHNLEIHQFSFSSDMFKTLAEKKKKKGEMRFEQMAVFIKTIFIRTECI